MEEQRRAHEAQRLVLENDKELAADEQALVEEEVTLLSSSLFIQPHRAETHATGG